MMSHAYINASRGGILWHKDSCCHFKQVATISTTEWASASCLWYPICWLFLFSNFSGLFSSYCLFFLFSSSSSTIFQAPVDFTPFWTPLLQHQTSLHSNPFPHSNEVQSSLTLPLPLQQGTPPHFYPIPYPTFFKSIQVDRQTDWSDLIAVSCWCLKQTKNSVYNSSAIQLKLRGIRFSKAESPKWLYGSKAGRGE